MLGLLISLGIFGGAAIKAGIDNASMMSYTTKKDENGNVHYLDRKCNEYINGEKITWKGYTDSQGIYHRTQVGVNSGKVYTDNLSSSEQLKKQFAEEEERWAREHNRAIVQRYNPRFKRQVTTEISTGKVIACVFDYKYNGKMHYRKFYVKPDAKEWEYNKIAKGDFGIEISKDEWDRMNTRLGSHSQVPYDQEILAKLHDGYGIDK